MFYNKGLNSIPNSEMETDTVNDNEVHRLVLSHKYVANNDQINTVNTPRQQMFSDQDDHENNNTKVHSVVLYLKDQMFKVGMSGLSTTIKNRNEQILRNNSNMDEDTNNQNDVLNHITKPIPLP
ncbi:hypothetical protein DGG96_09495 [Legionella qingyii]|uniref:Uncharacterized protein n=1 Tax=Legionella qingyii TaxID=2184757 RepID=A0A317U3W9_9GAMM|nr:hypothetical protein DGG96_09495 [Legionella qingyii]